MDEFKEPIEDVGQSTTRLLFSKYRFSSLVWITFAIVWFILVIIILLPTVNWGDGDFVFLLALLPAIAFAGWWASLYKQVHSEFMRQFAKRNNFRFHRFGTSENRRGLLFAFGHRQEVDNHISGNLSEFPIEIYNYKSTTGSGKSSVDHEFTIFEVKAKHEIPQLFLNSKKAPFMSDSNKPLALSEDNILKLEGDFNKYFDLYVPIQYEQEALQIFTPDIMAELIDTSQKYDLEIVGKTVRVIAKDYITNSKVLDEMFNHAKKLIKLFEKTLTKFKYELIGDFSPQLKTGSDKFVAMIVGFIIVVLAFIVAIAIIAAG